MALPTITNNSPAAGSIAWTATNVSWADQTWPIAAGNTNKKFVWWEYRNGVPATVTGDTLPTLAAGDMILFLNKNGVGALVPTMEIQDGSLLVPGSILAGAIAADQIQSYHVQADAINAGHIQANSIGATEIAAGAISANHISAGAITAEKLSVGTVSDNMVVNGSFEDALSGTLVGWEAYQVSNGTITPVTGVASSGAVSIQFDATATTANLRMRQLPAQYIPVSAASGRKYYISVRAGASVATTTGHYQRVNWYDGNKAFISSSDIRNNQPLTTTFTLYEGQVTPPANAKYMGMEVLVTNINVIAKVYIDEISAHEVTMAAQIGDGQISAAKIVAGTITSDRIASSGITADKVLIADFTNWFVNPGFNQGSTFLDNWNAGSGVAIANTNFVSGRALENTLTGSYASRYQTKTFAVEANDKFFVSGTTYCTTGGFAPTIRMIFRDVTGTMIAGTGNQGTAATDTAGAYVERSAILTAPAGAASATLWVEMHNPLGATQRVGDLICRRMNGGELIVDGAITATKIATDAVTANAIAANAVTATEIAADAVTATKILAGAIGTNHMTANTINGDRIAANSLDADKIVANSITSMQIEAGTITANEIGANAVLSDKIGANAVVAGKIAAGAVTATEIAANTITASQMAANTITAGQIAANTLTANELAANTITAAQIAANTLTANEIASNAITADEIASNTITAAEIAADTITATEIAAGAITATEIAAGTITGDRLTGTAIDGKTITGATIQTASGATTGLKLDSAGLRAYDGSGVKTFDLTSSDGKVKLIGRIRTAADNEAGAVLLPGAETADNTTGLFINPTSALPGQVTAGVWVTNPTAVGAKDIYIRGHNYGNVRLVGGTITDSVTDVNQTFMIRPNGLGYSWVDADNFTFRNHPTTGAAANAVVAVSPLGRIYRSTSSIRYKKDVEDWNPGMKALGLRPRSWVDKNPMNPEKPDRLHGFIAEEVEEILPELVQYNEDGLPESLNYDRFSAAIIPVLQNLTKRIEELEAQLLERQ